MNKHTKLTLAVIGVGAIAYYIYTQNKTTKKDFSGKVGNRLGFADGGYVLKGDLYNNNQRYGTAWIGEKKSLTGGNTFFTNQPEKLNY
jgi:hypothetical protein